MERRMTHRMLIPVLLGGLVLAVTGCGPAAEDAAPLPKQDPQTRLDNARQQIEASNMTPEQKKAALGYMNSQAEGAQKMRQAQGAPKGP